MFKQIHPYTTLALLLFFGSAGLLFTNVPYSSSALAMLAILFALSETAKFTNWFQFSVLFFSSAALGVSLELPFTGEYLPDGSTIPFVRISCVLAVAVNYVRLIFFVQFGYSRFRYFEFSLMNISIGLYIAGNILHPGGWEKWAFPAPASKPTTSLATRDC